MSSASSKLPLLFKFDLTSMHRFETQDRVMYPKAKRPTLLYLDCELKNVIIGNRVKNTGCPSIGYNPVAPRTSAKDDADNC